MKQNTRLEGEWINNVQNRVLRERQSHKNTSLCPPTSNSAELSQFELHREIFPFPRHPGVRLHWRNSHCSTVPEGATAEPKGLKPRVYLPLQATGQEAWTGFFFQPGPAFAPPGMLSSSCCRLLSIFASPMIHHQILHKSTERKQSEWVTTDKIQTHSTWKR